jgi:hypothetical protein
VTKPRPAGSLESLPDGSGSRMIQEVKNSQHGDFRIVADAGGVG